MRFATRLSALALAAAGMVAAAGAQAQSMDVRVTGTVTPPACVPTLAGGGVVDYGKIYVGSLSRTAFNPLAEKTLAFSITCGMPTRIALRPTDNRTASQVRGITAVLGSDAAYEDGNFGLGAVSGANIGGYVMRMMQGTFTADGNAVHTVYSSNSGVSWARSLLGGMLHTAQWRTSWSGTQAGRPISFSSLSGTFSVEAVLNRGDALPLEDEVPLDGLATLEMVYL
ncbi:DUF1120 domain-containing protein [Oceanisphaera sp. KMM 10153]|uniref:DUF1120 domain-containing protein n=1 Tax=Oceanisphaera submarina TaxID=3390193 RepID=UPI00397652F1